MHVFPESEQQEPQGPSGPSLRGVTGKILTARNANTLIVDRPARLCIGIFAAAFRAGRSAFLRGVVKPAVVVECFTSRTIGCTIYSVSGVACGTFRAV